MRLREAASRHGVELAGEASDLVLRGWRLLAESP